MATSFKQRQTGAMSQERLERLVTVDQLSDLLHVQKSTIYSWCTYQRIPFYRLGRRSLFDPVEISEWLDARRVEPIGGAR